jgi:hypothetical protein
MQINNLSILESSNIYQNNSKEIYNFYKILIELPNYLKIQSTNFFLNKQINFFRYN